MSEKNAPCRRCLLSEINEAEIIADIERAKAKLKENEKAAESEYKRRLRLCTDCNFLLNGCCEKCGCYVELRAAIKQSHCPLAGNKKRW